MMQQQQRTATIKRHTLETQVSVVLNVDGWFREFRCHTGLPSGYFQQQLYVYGRAGRPCYSCGDTIMVTKQQGRSSFWCCDCQK